MTGLSFAITTCIDGITYVYNWLDSILGAANIPLIVIVSVLCAYLFISRFAGAFIGGDARLGRFASDGYNPDYGRAYIPSHTPYTQSFAYEYDHVGELW